MEKHANHSSRTNSWLTIRNQLSLTQVLGIAGTALIALSGLLVLMMHQRTNDYGLHYSRSFEQLLETAMLEDKLCVVKFEAPFCFPCTFSEPRVEGEEFRELIDRFVMYEMNALDLNGEGMDMAGHYAVTTLPTWLVLDGEGNELKRWEGPGIPTTEELGTLHALHSIPGQNPSSVEAPDAGSARYSLLWEKGLNYWDAIALAEQLEPAILESVWIQPTPFSNWEVVSGTYQNLEEAGVALKFLREWEHQELQIVELTDEGWELP